MAMLMLMVNGNGDVIVVNERDLLPLGILTIKISAMTSSASGAESLLAAGFSWTSQREG